MEKSQWKIRSLRQFLRGWAENTSGHNRKEKKRLVALIDDLDKRQKILCSNQELNETLPQ